MNESHVPHLERHVRHDFCEVVALHGVPVVEVLALERVHLKGKRHHRRHHGREHAETRRQFDLLMKVSTLKNISSCDFYSQFSKRKKRNSL